MKFNDPFTDDQLLTLVSDAFDEMVAQFSEVRWKDASIPRRLCPRVMTAFINWAEQRNSYSGSLTEKIGRRRP